MEDLLLQVKLMMITLMTYKGFGSLKLTALAVTRPGATLL